MFRIIIQKFVVALLLIISISACSQEVKIDNLEEKDNVSYFNGELYTGKAISRFDNGKLFISQNFLNGNLSF